MFHEKGWVLNSPAAEHPLLYGPESQQGNEKDNPVIQPKLWCIQTIFGGDNANAAVVSW